MKNIRYKLILSFLLAAVCAFWVSRQLKPSPSDYKPMTVSMDVAAEHQGTTIQLCYTVTSTELFNNEHTTKPLDVSNGNLKVELPIDSLIFLRLNFSGNPGKIRISNFSIVGDTTIKVTDFSSLMLVNIQNSSFSSGSFTLVSCLNQPQITFPTPFKLEAPHSRTVVYLKSFGAFVGFFILAFIVFTLLEKLSKRPNGGKMVYLILINILPALLIAFFVWSLFKQNAWVVRLGLFVAVYVALFFLSSHFYNSLKNQRVENLLLAFCFLFICIVPSFFMGHQEISMLEQRMLNKFPDTLNHHFPERFDSWYMDHFPFRDTIVAANNACLNFGGFAHNQTVIEGKDGWLFFKGDNCLENYANIDVINDNDLEIIRKYVIAINNWCNDHHKKFYVLFCPNKSTVYGEYMRCVNKVKSDENNDVARVIRVLRNSGIKVVYAKDKLLSLKNNGSLLYFKQDTHHNYLGGYYCYQAIMEKVAEDYPVKITPDSAFLHSGYKNVATDLNSQLPGVLPYDTTTYWHLTNLESNIQITNPDPNLLSMYNPNQVGGVYLLGDSFSSLMVDYFASSFKYTTKNILHQYFLTQEDLNKIEAEADVVILEVVERHTSKLAKQPMDPIILGYFNNVK